MHLETREMCPYQDGFHQKLVDFSKSARSAVAEKLSEGDIIELRNKLERLDKERDGMVSVKDFVTILGETGLSRREINTILPGPAFDARLDYNEFIALALETLGRHESERVAVTVAELNHRQDSGVPKEELRNMMGGVVTERTLDSILAGISEDVDGLVSTKHALDALAQKNVELITEFSSSQDEELTEGLVDAEHAVIPGGRNNPLEKPTYVYDSIFNTLRKANP